MSARRFLHPFSLQQSPPIELSPTMAEKHLEDSLHDDDVGRKNSILHAEVLAEPELMSGAYLAEEREHNQTLWVSRCGVEACWLRN
jgi:hypothetical protein